MNKKEMKTHGSYELRMGIYYSGYHEFCSLKEHYHPEMEIVRIDDGNASLMIDKETYELKKGDIVIIEPNKLHNYKTNDKEIRSTTIVFDLSLISNQLYEYSQKEFIEPLIEGNVEVKHVINSSDIGYLSILSIINRIIESYHKMFYGYQLELKAYLSLIIYYLVNQKLLKVIKGLKESDLVNDIIEFINSNYQNDIYVSDIANHFAYSESYLMRFFKKTTGMTIKGYLNRVRLNKARQMLEETNLSVTEIANEICFSDVSYFIELFSKAFLITPYQFRKSKGGKHNANS